VSNLHTGVQLPAAAASAGIGANVTATGQASGGQIRAAAPSATLATIPAAAFAPKAAAQSNASRAPETTLQRLAQPLPDFANQGDASKGSSEADFTRRVGGRAQLEAEGTAVLAETSASQGVTLSKSKKGTPERPEETEPTRPGTSHDGSENLDPLGNPKRGNEDRGPDSREDSGSNVGPALLGAAGMVLGELSMGRVKEAMLMLPMLVVSLILHEMGHARAAYKLGDAGPVLAGRTSFRPKDLMTHIDPFWTIAMPLFSFISSGALFGMARPVQTDSSRFQKPTRGMALTALAGPAVNVALSIVGAIAFAGFGALGLPAVASAAALFTMLNVSLAIFNLVPLFPLDGHHILYSVLPWKLEAKLKNFYATAGWLAYAPLVAFMFAAGGMGVLSTAIAWGTSLMLGTATAGAHLALGSLPAMAALGLLFGQKDATGPPSLQPGKTVPSDALDGQKPVEFVVLINKPAAAFAADQHLSWVDEKARNSVSLYARTTQSMLAQIDAAGVSAQGLLDRGAAPIATYKRINAMTLRVDATSAPQLKQWLESQGHAVFDNARREIVRPMPLDPESADPSSRNPVTMAENLRITKADAVQKIGRQRYGEPELGFWARLGRRITGAATAPQPPVAVIDTGADTTHPQLKRVKEVKNATSGPNTDDNGHGSWVTSMVLNYAPWLKSVTHYKTFVDGGATLDDILKALTMAGNDGNLVISNSWGSDDGATDSPDSKLVQKLAEEGHIMVFAAGNAGPKANTVGSPAIVQYKDAKTGAIRVVAVAASDRDKKIVYFSSRGPGSPATKGDPALAAHRPDLTGVGYNTDGAWPANLGPDKTDPQLGPLKAISGTSMSTPSIAGAISLLCLMFGVTTKGEKLDAVVNAVMGTLVKTGQSRDAEGEGFIDVEAAYKALEAVLGPSRQSFAGRWARSLAGDSRFRAIPGETRAEYLALVKDMEYYDKRHEKLRDHRLKYDEDVDVQLDEMAVRDRARMKELEARYPQLENLTSLRGRIWRALAGE
jgi:Zn-dependent protease